MRWIESLICYCKHFVSAKPKPEQWNIDTYILRVGGKLWAGERGYFTIVRVTPRSVFVLADDVTQRHNAMYTAKPAV
jgi:hypothetical protein